MNHVKCIINANISRRVPSNTRITHCSCCKSELGFRRRSFKVRSPRVDDTFKLVMRKIYQLLLERRREEIKISKKAILYGQLGTRSKSIATSVRKFLSERKLPLKYIENIIPKRDVRFSSSSSMCYDHSVDYKDDRNNRSYAQMITAYNETMTTIYNTPDMIRNRSKSKMNDKLSKTLFRTTSTLSYPTYNIENFIIKESTEETSTDLSCAVDTNFNRSRGIDNDLYEKDEKTNNLKTRTIPKTTARTYASIIADYSAAVDKDLTSDKNEDHFPNLSLISHSPVKVTTSETSDFVSSPVLNTDSLKQISINEEIDWLRKVDKIIKDLKKSTGEKDKKIDKNVSSLKETNVLESIMTDQTPKVNTMNFIEVTSDETAFSEKNINEENVKNYKENQEIQEIKTEKVDNIKMTSQSSSPTYKSPTSSNLTSTTKKNWSQIPKNTESNILQDPQVELRMVPSGNESVVSVNLEGITKVMESKNPNSKELSIIVSNNKKTLSKALPKKSEHQLNSCSMHISISEGSLPVKELELSVNGKPISDVRSIKARSETLNVLTSLDKVEIRVPYAKENLNALNQSTKNIMKNVESSESVLKLRIATAFDDINPTITSGDTKKLLHKRSDLESDSPKIKLTHAENSDANVKMSELSSTSIKSKDQSNIQKIPVKKVEKPSEVNVKKAYKSDKIQEKFERSKIKKDSLERSNTSKSLGSKDDVKKNDEAANDIDLRLSKTFNDKASMRSNLNVRKFEQSEPKIVSNSSGRNIGNESFKQPNLKSASSDKSTIKSSRMTDKAAIKNSASDKAFAKPSEKPSVKVTEKMYEKVSEKPSDKTSEKDKVTSLADIVARHSGHGRSSDGSSTPVTNKPKPSSGKLDSSKSPRSNKRDSKTIDDITKKFVSNNQSFKIDSYDERMLSKSSPWRSNSYMKSKKEEDNQKSFSASSEHDKQKTNQLNRTYASNDKLQSKLTQDSSSKEKKPSTRWQNPPIEVKSSKVENKYDTKDLMTYSKPLDGEKTLKSSSTFKSGNVQITRDDPVLVNEKTTGSSSLSSVKIAEEKLNKRNDASLKREVKNVSTTKEVESMKKNVSDEKRLTTEKKDSVGIQMKELPKSDVLMKIIDPGINPSQQNVDKVRNEQLIRQKVASSEEKLNMQTSDKKDSLNDVAKQTMNTNDLKDRKINNILNSMKPIEKKKDGTLIDYGVKVASRKKPEKLTSRIKDVVTNEVAKDKVKEMDSIRVTIKEKATEKGNQRLDNRDEIKSSTLIKPITIPIQSSIKYSPRNVEHTKMDKMTNELKSSNIDDVDKGKKLDPLKKDVNLKAVDSEKNKNESLREKLSKTLERLKENVPNVKESEKLNSVKYFDDDSIKELSPSTKETSTKIKNTMSPRRSDEGTVIQNASKYFSRSRTLTDSLTETILRCPSKELEKKKSKNLSHKHSSKNIQENSNIKEKPRGTSNSMNLLVDNINKNKGDSSGSTNNSGTSSNPSNTNNSSSSKKTKPYTSMSIELIKFEMSHTHDVSHDYKETDKQSNVEVKDEYASKLKRPEKELVYAVWLQRKKETTDDKMS